MRLQIFGGTTEGRLLAGRAAELGARCTVSVATPLGREELAGLRDIQVVVGRRDGAQIARLAEGFDLCVDATHPYARLASAHIRAGCGAVGVPLVRLLRAPGGGDCGETVPDCPAAARRLAGTEGNILLATGAKELAAFAALPPERLYARVLPTHRALEACEALGLPHSHILALQGPFTQKMNKAMLEQYHIAWLVTKDGGGPGGFAEKVPAARAAGARLLVVGRPEETGEPLERVVALIRDRLEEETR